MNLTSKEFTILFPTLFGKKSGFHPFPLTVGILFPSQQVHVQIE